MGQTAESSAGVRIHQSAGPSASVGQVDERESVRREEQNTHRVSSGKFRRNFSCERSIAAGNDAPPPVTCVREDLMELSAADKGESCNCVKKSLKLDTNADLDMPFKGGQGEFQTAQPSVNVPEDYNYLSVQLTGPNISVPGDFNHLPVQATK